MWSRAGVNGQTGGLSRVTPRMEMRSNEVRTINSLPLCIVIGIKGRGGN